jgi:acetyl esterase/lipase
VARDSHDILDDPPPPAADARLVYGPEPKQFGDLRLPAGDGPFPLIVVVHGGGWEAQYNLIHMGHLCVSLRDTGLATWSVEYRACGDVGGPWPGAGDDVARGVEFTAELTDRYPLDKGRVALAGHSAGGQLVLWAAKRARLPVVALAAVSDLRESAERVGPHGAVARFLGGMPDDVPDRYAEASPRGRLPLGVRQILVHGDADLSVPYVQSVSYVEAAAGEAELVTLAGAGHFELIDPQAREFPATVTAICSLLEPSPPAGAR